jgi:hypothetical protein
LAFFEVIGVLFRFADFGLAPRLVVFMISGFSTGLTLFLMHLGMTEATVYFLDLADCFFFSTLTVAVVVFFCFLLFYSKKSNTSISLCLLVIFPMLLFL